MKSKIDSEEDTCDNPCTCTVLLGKGHHMTRDLQPQRDIDRERERAGSSVVSIETLCYKTRFILKMYYRQTGQVVSRQYITNTKH